MKNKFFLLVVVALRGIALEENSLTGEKEEKISISPPPGRKLALCILCGQVHSTPDSFLILIPIGGMNFMW